MAFLHRKWPSRPQWRQFLKVLNRKEKIIFFVFLFLAIGSASYTFNHIYLDNTQIVPAKGGTYTEGVIGSPRNINPVYAQTNDVDRDLSELIYSGLMKYSANGEIVTDLAEKYSTLEDGKIFEFYLKENLLWADGKPITANDVIFTVKTIQNPSFKSPIRASWLGVKVDKISDLGIRFELASPSVVFLENSTLKIMPEHIWKEISEQNFSLSIYNLKPVGSGPYKVKDVAQDKEGNIKSLELIINGNYHGDLPHIQKVFFSFFEDENKLISAFKAGQIDGFSSLFIEKYQEDSLSEYRLLTPRYFAVFFNPEKSKILAEVELRQALNYGINKTEVVNEILPLQAETIDSPILPDVYGFADPSEVYEFNPEKAKEILDEAGFIVKEDSEGIREKIVKKEAAFQFKSNLQVGSQGNEVQELQKCLAKDPEVYPEGETTGYFGEKTRIAVVNFQEKYKEEVLTPYGLTQGTGRVLQSTREKLNQLCAASSEKITPLSFTLTTVDQETLIKVAANLKKQWGSLGIKTEIKIVDNFTLTEEVIRPRDYELILLGQGLEMVIDPFPFWHSSQIKDPGLNLSLYKNKEADKLLEKARQTMDPEKRKAALEEFQDILIKDSPAIFLYSLDYPYLVSEKIKGISVKIITDPSKRFLGIEEWYIKTKRVWK